MKRIANSPESSANFWLTARQNPSICAALPRSSNGKTTDSDSVGNRPVKPIVRNLNPVCSPRETAKYEGECELSNAQIIAELTRAKCVFQLATICAVLKGEQNDRPPNQISKRL